MRCEPDQLPFQFQIGHCLGMIWFALIECQGKDRAGQDRLGHWVTKVWNKASGLG